MAAISKQDAQFFLDLSARDAHKNLFKLCEIAAREYEGVPLANFIICIDYTTLPEIYTLKLLANEPASDLFETNQSANAEARNKALYDKAKKHPEKFVLIESAISNGGNDHLPAALVTCEFWNGNASFGGGDGRVQSEDDEGLGEYNLIDEVDVQMARSALN